MRTPPPDKHFSCLTSNVPIRLETHFGVLTESLNQSPLNGSPRTPPSGRLLCHLPLAPARIPDAFPNPLQGYAPHVGRENLQACGNGPHHLVETLKSHRCSRQRRCAQVPDRTYPARHWVVLRHPGLAFEMKGLDDFVFIDVYDGFRLPPFVRNIQLVKRGRIGAPIGLCIRF